MNVGDVMTRELVTALPDTDVSTLARSMLDRHVSGLPVVDEDGRLLGLVTAEDLVTKQARVHFPIYFGLLGGIVTLEAPGTEEEIERALATNAEQIMERRPVTASPDDAIEDVAALMVDKHANPIPVLDGGRLVGIVSHRDIIRLLVLPDGSSR